MMRVRVCVLLIIILRTIIACQTTLVGVQATPVLPTLASFPSLTPLPQRTLRATQTPRDIATTTLVPSPTALPSPTAPATMIFTPIFQPTVQATSEPPHRANALVIGQSAEGRDIVAYRFGSGAQIILLVGGIHTGYEGNTVVLINELIEHFERAPQDVLPGISLMLIPVANPDGLTRGRETSGRFNANRVDLNRNWGCGWLPEARWRNETVDPGPSAFSEPETQALAQFIRELRPSAVVFYHSAASGVFAGNCDGDHGSLELAAVIGEAANYPYGEDFAAYPVTGTAASWVDGQGIPAVDLELTTTRSSEFVRNLNGIMAVQCWLVANNCS